MRGQDWIQDCKNGSKWISYDLKLDCPYLVRMIRFPSTIFIIIVIFYTLFNIFRSMSTSFGEMDCRIISLVAFALMLPVCAAVEPMVWEIDWNDYQTIDFENFEPFSSPGVIIGDYTFENTMDVLGRAWVASSPQEIIGLVCVHYGPQLYSLTNEYGTIRDTCNHIVTSLKWGTISDIVARCETEWDNLTFGSDENSTLFTLNECYTTVYDYPISPSIPIEFQYAGDIIAGVYSSCPGGYGLGTDRLSALASGVLDWFGPSILSLANGDTYQTAFAGCSILRYVLTMDITDLLSEVTDLLSYPIADVLEYLQYLQVCSKFDESVDHSEGFNLIFDLLLSFSGRTSTSMCSFFSASNTRDDYEEEAANIADNILSVITDAALCRDLMAELATSTDAIDILESITGDDLSLAANRNSLCNDIVDAFTTGSSATLESYSLPNGVDINQYDFFSVPGELLPNLNFAEALTIFGAMYTSNSVADAAVVSCDVFENFLVDNDVFYGIDLAELCTFARNDDLADIESVCLEQSIPVYNQDYPLSLRQFDPLMTAVDMGRKLLGVEMFSQSDVCTALDSFVHSDHNLRSIVSFGISSFTKEGLPSANDICQDWTNVICYLGPYCNAYTPYQETEQTNYMDTVTAIQELILMALGYSTRSALCNEISAGIDTLSGRATDDVINDMTSKILYVFENTARCIEVADKVIEIVSSEMGADGGTSDPEELIYMVTGHNTTGVCDIVAATFPSFGEYIK